jgi:hypothetical protein
MLIVDSTLCMLVTTCFSSFTCSIVGIIQDVTAVETAKAQQAAMLAAVSSTAHMLS